MEDQLGAILGDPEMMQKIQALAQSMGQSQSTGQPEKPERAVQPSPAGPGPGDLEMLKAFTGFARGAEIDQNKRSPPMSAGRKLPSWRRPCVRPSWPSKPPGCWNPAY